MATNLHLPQPMPQFVIDTCPSNDDQELIKPTKQSFSTILRSWSLPNCNETYKDLCGAIHYSFSNPLNNIFKRSRSYPNNYHLTYAKFNEKYFHIPSPSTSIQFNTNWLTPMTGTQTPGGSSSSRYSLYGSFFDLSESGFCPPSDQQFLRSDKKILTNDGRPLLVVDQSTRLSTNTYQDKCTHWLSHLNTSST